MAALEREIAQSRGFDSPAQEALLNLLRTASLLERQQAAFFRPYGVTATQYNALRILRGRHPEPLACGTVGERLVTPVPDVTRLLDRLAAKGLIERHRATSDRRVVRVAITEAGLELLAKIDRPLAAWLEDQLGGLGARRLERLSRLLERVRQAAGRAPG